MIYVALSILLWLPAILGYETIFHWIYQRVTHSTYDIRDVSEPVFGFIIIEVIATLVNFIMPVNGIASISTLILGWCLCSLRIRKWPAKLSWSTAIIAGLGLAAVSLMASRGDKLYDTGLYYLQSLKWLQEVKTPLGLANLHGRLAYNQSWFTISATMELPFFFKPGTGYFVSTAMLLWLFGLRVKRAIADLFTKNAFAYVLFLPLSFILLISDSQFLPLNASSTSPDVPAAILILLASLSALQILEGRLDPTFGIWTSILIAFFAITAKFSAVPIILIPVSLSLFAYFHKLPVNWKALAKLLIIAGVILLVPWTFRSIFLSGCLLYPSQITCISGLRWSWISPPETSVYNPLWIMSWARNPDAGILPSQVLSNWDWFGPWLKRHLETANTFQLIIAAWLLGLGLWPLAYQVKKNSNNKVSVFWLLIPLAVGNAYWFFMAPEPRFGLGLLWALPTTIIAYNLSCILQALPDKIVYYRWGFIIILAACSIPGGRELIMGSAYDIHQYRHSLLRSLYTTVPLPPPNFYKQRTSNGVRIYLPREDSQCWAAPLPCTPNSPTNKDLQITNVHGFLMFWIEK